MPSPSVKIGRDDHVWSFDAKRQPVVTVAPGTIIEIETWDCFTGQVQSEEDTLEKLDLTRVNSATGPIAVRGAEPGDTLSVTLLDIRPNEKGAAINASRAAGRSSEARMAAITASSMSIALRRPSTM